MKILEAFKKEVRYHAAKQKFRMSLSFGQAYVLQEREVFLDGFCSMITERDEG